jgi:stearoyl-CoA desaturase (delta-9 desaturase)
VDGHEACVPCSSLNPKADRSENPKRIGRTDISDLNENAVVVWQHRNYVQVALVMGLLFPAAVAGIFWGDWVGGLVYAGILRVFFVQQASE